MSDNLFRDLNLEPILSITVTQPMGRASILHLYQYDTPLQMAYRFANENKLQVRYVKQLGESIKQIISAALVDSRVDERVKTKIRASYEKYVVENKKIDFRLEYQLSELINMDSDLTKPSQSPPARVRFKTEVDYDTRHSFQPDIYERGQLQKQLIEEKVKHIRSFQEQTELKVCTFSPSINHNKSHHQASQTRFQQLYEYGTLKVKERRSYSGLSEKDTKELQQCTFQPRIGNKSQEIHNKKKQPTLSESKSQTQVSKLLQQLISMNKKRATKPVVKQNHLRTIFHHLDSDSDGFISPDRIEIDSISVSVLQQHQTINDRILYPVFQWMEDSQVELNYQEFQEVVTKFYPNAEKLLAQVIPKDLVKPKHKILKNPRF